MNATNMTQQTRFKMSVVGVALVFSVLYWMFFSCVAQGATYQIQLTLVVTNAATNGQSLTINGSTRTWTNTVTTPASQIRVTNTTAWTATNLYVNLAAYAVPGPVPMAWATNATNTILLLAAPDAALTYSISGDWGYGTLSTQALVSGYVVRVPVTSERASVRTNVVSGLIEAIGNTGATNLVPPTAPAFAGYLTRTNGYGTNTVLQSPKFTNAVNYGNAFSSPGTGADSEEFGLGATATNTATTALGNNAVAGGAGSTAIGSDANATGDYTTASGSGSSASGYGAIAYGLAADASGSNAVAIGSAAQAGHVDSMALGSAALTTTSNQIVLGSTFHNVIVPGVLNSASQSNSMFYGTNTVSGDFAITPTTITTVASGANTLAPAATTTYLYLSGTPGAAWSLVGMSGGRAGRLMLVENNTGYAMTVAHESGLESTAGNRLAVSSSVDVQLSGRQTAVFVYNGTSSRWVLVAPHVPANTLYYPCVTNNNGTAVASVLTNIPSGYYPVSQFGYMAFFGTNAVACSDVTVYTNFASALDYNRILTNGFTGDMAEGFLTNSIAGYYTVTIGCTIVPAADNNADEIEIALFVNGVEQQHITGILTLLTGVSNTLIASGLAYLPAGSWLDARVRNKIDATCSLDVRRLIFNIGTP